jgi:hypothetical protein
MMRSILYPTAGRTRKAAMLFAVAVGGNVAGTGRSAAAAVLSGSYTSTPPSSANLTTAGPVDWAIWTQTATGAYGATATAAVPDNRKTGVTSIIGNATVVGAPTTVRGVGGTGVAYTYTDGTSPATLTNTTVGGVTSSGLDVTGNGVQVTVVGDPTRTLFVNVYVGGFVTAANTFTASLAGATTFTDTSSTFPSATPKVAGLYTLAFRPDNIGDALTLRYTLTENTTGGNSHVLLQAVAVSTVPEPAAAGLLAVGGAVALLRRRRVASPI